MDMYVPWSSLFYHSFQYQSSSLGTIIRNDTVMYWSDDFFYERNFEMLSIFFTV